MRDIDVRSIEPDHRSIPKVGFLMKQMRNLVNIAPIEIITDPTAIGRVLDVPCLWSAEEFLLHLVGVFMTEDATSLASNDLDRHRIALAILKSF